MTDIATTPESPSGTETGTDRTLAPDEFLRGGRADAARLLVLWYLRKSAYWLAFTGSTIAHLTNRTDEADVDWLDAQGVWNEVRSPLVGLVLAVAFRMGTRIGGLVLAYPLTREYEAPLEPRPGSKAFIGKWLDRRHVTAGFRTLRWSHHVRQAALRRLGDTGRRVGRLDPILDVVNVASFVVLVFAIAAAAS